MAEENTARAVEGNAVRFRPSPLPGHVKPNAPNQDIAWEWNSLKDINNRKQVTYDFCGKIRTGGITRAKRHQMGVRGDCGSSHKCPEDVKETLKAAFINKKNERDAYLKETDDLDEDSRTSRGDFGHSTRKKSCNCKYGNVDCIITNSFHCQET
ncbi:hypothetical protein RJT34_00400 [Clitoria ternatea]|uniref:Uncharacterized protein n=1 Tax=Clitoria ternatea TaxID=43366 RepID=A0AAN9Q2P0_CLITE